MKTNFFSKILIKIFAGILSVGGVVVLIQWLSGFFPEKLTANNDIFNLVLSIVECFVAVASYIALYRIIEKRRISELSGASFLYSAMPGFFTGILLQTLIILVLYIAGGYIVTRINPASYMVPALSTALTAGFVAEIIIRGVLFRLVEEKLGTILTISLMMLLFIVLHMGGPGHTMLSLAAVSMQAGFLLSAVYVLTRNLWFPVFLHFAWDFAEPGIFGAINPGNSVAKSLVTSHVSGPDILTGGNNGPVNSLQSLLICLLTGLIFLWIAKKRGSFILPFWKKTVDISRIS